MNCIRIRYFRGSYSTHFGPYFAPLHLSLLLLLWGIGLIPTFLVVGVLFLAAILPHLFDLCLPKVGQPASIRKKGEDLLPKKEEEEEGEQQQQQQQQQKTGVIVIGAGAAGLAAAAELKQHGIPYLVLEANDKVGEVWEKRYSRLHLHTSKFISSLPYFPLPTWFPAYPSRLDVANYLRAYHQLLDLNVLFGKRVTEILGKEGEDGTKWEVKTQDGSLFNTKAVVVCLGESSRPNEPVWNGEDSFQGPIFHSSRYQSGKEWKGKRVLVVGAGNTAMELMLDLYENGAKGTMAIRGKEGLAIVERDLGPFYGIPFQMSLGLHLLPSSLLDPVFAVASLDPKDFNLPFPKKKKNIATDIVRCKPPIIDIGTLALLKNGEILVKKGAIERIEGNNVFFTDDESGQYDVVVKATGYLRNTAASFPVLGLRERDFNEDGLPICSPKEGLFFCGYRDHIGRIREMGIEAAEILSHLRPLFPSSVLNPKYF